MKCSLVLLAPALVLALGCSKKSNDQAGDKSATAEKSTDSKKKEDSPAATKQLDAAFFGKTIAPPGKLAPVKPGMKKEELDKVVPDSQKLEMEDTGYDGVSYAVQMLDGAIPGVHLPGNKLGLIEQAWGPGTKTDRGGTPVVVWFNPDQGIRASLENNEKDRAYLRFEPYMPVAKLLGDGKGLPLLDKPFQGKTEDELKAMYPNLVTSTGHLGFPATEWEFGGEINLSAYPMDKPVQSFAFSIPFKTPEQQAEIMKLIEAKWGKAKSEVPFGSVGGEKTWVYNKKDPHIEVTEPGGYNKNAVTIRIGGK